MTQERPARGLADSRAGLPQILSAHCMGLRYGRPGNAEYRYSPSWPLVLVSLLAVTAFSLGALALCA